VSKSAKVVLGLEPAGGDTKGIRRHKAAGDSDRTQPLHPAGGDAGAAWDPTFSEHSFGFRPKRSAHQVVARAQEYIAWGHGIVVDVDLEKSFDNVIFVEERCKTMR